MGRRCRAVKVHRRPRVEQVEDVGNEPDVLRGELAQPPREAGVEREHVGRAELDIVVGVVDVLRVEARGRALVEVVAIEVVEEELPEEELDQA